MAAPPTVSRARTAALRAIPAVLAVVALSGCSLLADPAPPREPGGSLAPVGSMGYVVCPDTVTPVELSTGTQEPGIPLSIPGTPSLGDFAIATSLDGQWAYVDTTIGEPGVSRSTGTARPPGSPTSTGGPGSPSTVRTGPAPAPRTGVTNVVVPIDLATQRALAPIPIPGHGGTHAIVVMPGGRTVLAASGTTIVPVDAGTHDVGTPLDLGVGHTVFGLALDPRSPLLYVLVPGGVIPVDTATATTGREIPTGLSVSSVYSPHGITVSPDGATVYVVGQGGADFGGRAVPITASDGAVQPMAGFDRFGISDPAAIAVTADGSQLLEVDSADNWIIPIARDTFSDPSAPVRIPDRTGVGSATGTAHPTDIVIGPGATGAFVVDGFDALIPYDLATRSFGNPIPVCSGASSMAVAPSP